MTDSARKFPLSMRLLHWSMAALVLSMLFAGALMVESLAVWQPTLLSLHKSFGLLALLLVVLRVCVRLTSSLPTLPTSLPRIQRVTAKASHFLLYTCMFALPITGLLMQYYAARPVAVFGLLSLPAAMNADIEAFALYRISHEVLAVGLAALVSVHLLAALYHHWFRRDEVLKSML